MPNYLLAYHGGGGMPTTKAEQDKVMAAWGKWMGEIGAAMVDGGNPIGGTSTIASNGSVSTGDGANPLTGYSVITAQDMASAVAMAKGCPVLMVGGSIEVCETFNVM